MKRLLGAFCTWLAIGFGLGTTTLAQEPAAPYAPANDCVCDGPIGYSCCDPDDCGCCNGGGDCGCCNLCPCNDCASCWVIRAGAIVMHRSRPSSATLVSNFTNRPPTWFGTQLNAADLNFGYQAGFDVGAIRKLNDCWSLEGRYFQIDSWNANSGPTGVPNSGVSFQGARVGFPIPSFISASYSSLLRSAELNGRRELNGWLTALAGFRYINLDESLTVTQEAFAVGGFQRAHNARTTNNLFGGQLGAEASIWSCGRLRVDGYGKAGLYLNSATTDYNLPAVFNFHGQQDHLAFVGDISLTATYCVTNHVALRGGYQVLWVEGVALASDQFVAPSSAPRATVDATGGVFYHGFIAGLEISW